LRLVVRGGEAPAAAAAWLAPAAPAALEGLARAASTRSSASAPASRGTAAAARISACVGCCKSAASCPTRLLADEPRTALTRATCCTDCWAGTAGDAAGPAGASAAAGARALRTPAQAAKRPMGDSAAAAAATRCCARVWPCSTASSRAWSSDKTKQQWATILAERPTWPTLVTQHSAHANAMWFPSPPCTSLRLKFQHEVHT
jgi:hypothetical protein